MERFFASPYCKILVLCIALLAALGFAYHIGHNLRLAGVEHHAVNDDGRSQESLSPDESSLPLQRRSP
ncbi:hypothetical protein SAMN02745126_00423 [Enhydrobacter aerosaccus]|uniref:Uncharacterized protein n=1 Tax=Enhydrobacter aerosaccus TaxID=225324 RepID=A0A1T4JSU1_9HYPH|nr:hypothetical protein SAMN02745126_00423 [Enhydrobacter aerosaccus]